ncbi:hypothetical protein PoB_005590000 [Plakobranchus ocellatus]|uniref:Uncharacterized protein n=1 Tax=Plakobranchus ocellatus TaxID=259542 RepID=A0AAV4C9L1_9GAST|nr:hypothetical protein PoB_005590000 [Plakobranchus ocellatus]
MAILQHVTAPNQAMIHLPVIAVRVYVFACMQIGTYSTSRDASAGFYFRAVIKDIDSDDSIILSFIIAPVLWAVHDKISDSDDTRC